MVRGLPETSESSTVWVAPKRAGSDVRFLDRRRGLIKAMMFLDVSPKLPYDFDDRLFFYFAEKGSRRVVPKARSRTHLRSRGRVRGSARFKIPTDHKYRFYVTWCFEQARRDIGVGKPTSTRCPRKTVPTGAFGRSARVSR